MFLVTLSGRVIHFNGSISTYVFLSARNEHHQEAFTPSHRSAWVMKKSKNSLARRRWIAQELSFQNCFQRFCVDLQTPICDSSKHERIKKTHEMLTLLAFTLLTLEVKLVNCGRSEIAQLDKQEFGSFFSFKRRRRRLKKHKVSLLISFIHLKNLIL